MAWGAKLFQTSAMTRGMVKGHCGRFSGLLSLANCVYWKSEPTHPLIRSTCGIVGSVKKISQNPANQLLAIQFVTVGKFHVFNFCDEGTHKSYL